MKKDYSAPKTTTNSSKLRTSILSGSNGGAFNGVPGGTVNTPPSMTIESRKRVKFEM